jgi:hypothetical protein
MTSSGLPEPPAYNTALSRHLQAAEPELWSWFASTPNGQGDDSAEIDLLKSAYRMDGGVHDVLTGHATLLAHQLGIDRPIALYQELGTQTGAGAGEGERNARVMELNGTIHVVFSGDLLDLLDETERQVVLAHELGHIALWDRDELAVLDHLVHRLASEAHDDHALAETARRLRLHTEVWADSVAAAKLGLNPVVSTIVKTSTGLRQVEPDAYLRQAQQIIESDPGSSRGLTHPEMHIRVACLAARSSPMDDMAADRLIDKLIGGDDDLDRLDLLAQVRVSALVGRVLTAGTAVLSDGEAGADGPSTNHRLAGYLAGYAQRGGPWAAGPGPLLADGELSQAQPSIRHLAAAILVDLAMACEATDDLDDLRLLSNEADRLGLAAEFDRVLAKATDRSPAEAKRLRATAQGTVS